MPRAGFEVRHAWFHLRCAANETFVGREKQMQQHHRLVISVHAWFAQHPGSVFRGLALTELVDDHVERSYTRAHQVPGVCPHACG